MTGSIQKIAITGAAGYLGSAICNGFERAGKEVYRLSRTKPADEAAAKNWRRFSLTDENPDSLFADETIGCLVHCAYDFSAIRWSDVHRVNVEGSLRLLKSAKRHGVSRIVYISSMSAFEGCRSLYGKAKREVEVEALRLGAAVIRPGLIYGKTPGGMVGALIGMVKRLPVIPLIGSGHQILYLTHEEDLVDLIGRLCKDFSVDTSAPIIAANREGKSFIEILRLFAARENRKRVFVPIPWRLVWAPLRAAEAVGIPLKFRSDSIISLINQDLHPDFTRVEGEGFRFRDFAINRY